MIAISGESLYLEANGLLHHVLRYGKVGNPSLILLAGITSPAQTADFIAVELAKLGLSIYVPDIRGRGQTQAAPAGRYSLEDYAMDVRELASALGLRDPMIVGHSMGARIAAAYSVLNGKDPHTPVVLVDPPICGPGRGVYATSIDSFMSQLNEAKAGTTVEAVRRFYPKWPERELRLRMHVLPTCDETAIRETHERFSTEDFFGFWERMTRPAALIYGEESPAVTTSGVADLIEANPNIDVFGVPEAGHMIPWDNMDGFMDALVPLLKQHV